MRRSLAAALLSLAGAFANDAGPQAELAKYREAARADPGNSRVQFNLGLACLRQGRPAEALPALDKAAADPELSAEARYLKGAAYFELGDFSKVAGPLAGLENSAHAEHVLYLLEESYRLTKKNAEARQAFHSLITRFPDSPWVHYLMGNAYEHQADHEKAIAEYRAALERDPALPNANFAIGYLYWQDKAFDDAKTWLRKETGVQPCHALAYYYLGEMARNDGELDNAAGLYRRAVGCNARDSRARLGLGIVLSALNRNEEALRALREASRLSPDNAAPHYRLAVLYRKLGRKAEAEAEYRRVREIHAAEPGEAEKP